MIFKNKYPGGTPVPLMGFYQREEEKREEKRERETIHILYFHLIGGPPQRALLPITGLPISHGTNRDTSVALTGGKCRVEYWIP